MDKQSKNNLKQDRQRLTARRKNEKTASSMITWGAISFLIGGVLIATVAGAPLGFLAANVGFFSFVIGVIWKILLALSKNAD